MKRLLVDLGEKSYNIDIEKGSIKDVASYIKRV